MKRYASQSTVSVEKSEAEIKSMLIKYGADGFGSMWQDRKAVIMFQYKNKHIRFTLPLPSKKDEEFTRKRNGHLRHQMDSLKRWEQACRQRWRALALTIKAKLEAVETGITTFENEFLANIVTPNGQTIGEWVVPQLEVLKDKMPKLLPGMN